MRSLAAGALMALALVAIRGVARADDAKPSPPPEIPAHRITYENTTGLRVNPLGVEEQFNLSYKARLYASDSLALRENYFGVGISPTLSPAVSRFGAHVEIRPLTMLSLSAGLYHVGYFGSFGALASFPSSASDYSDTALAANKDAGKNHPTHGFEFVGRALGLAKLGPVAFRSDTLVYYSDLVLPAGDEDYYYQRIDLLMPDAGVAITSDLDVAWLSDFGLVLGGRYSVLDAFIDDATDPGPEMRLGPIAAFTFFDTPGASFNKPTVVAMAQWWLTHPYRTSEDVSQAIPYGAIAFRFEGELWRAR
jgi:hypothetical protein